MSLWLIAQGHQFKLRGGEKNMFKHSFMKSSLWLTLGVLGAGISSVSANPQYLYVSMDNTMQVIKRVDLSTLTEDTNWVIEFKTDLGAWTGNPRHIATDAQGDIHVGFRDGGHDDGDPDTIKDQLREYDVATKSSLHNEGTVVTAGVNKIAIDNNYIYIAHEYANGIERVSLDYTTKSTLVTGGIWTSNRARGLEVFGGSLYAGHSPASGTSTIQKIDLADSSYTQFDLGTAPFSLNLQDIAITADGLMMYVADRTNNAVYALEGPNGAMPGSYVGILADSADGLNGPESLAIDSLGRIWVGNTGSSSAGVRGFLSDGSLVHAFTGNTTSGIGRGQGLAIGIIPEPATMSLLCIGGLLMIMRRR